MVWEAPVVEVFMVGRSEIISTIPGRLIPGGGTLRHNSAMNQFLEVVEECALVDLGYCGRKITWTNGQRGVNNIGERLDRALANEKWCLSFSFFRVQHLVRMKSNHSPVLLNFEVERSNVKDGWTGQTFGEKVQTCGDNLVQWDRVAFGSVKRKLDILRRKLEKVQQREHSDSNLSE
ncbi:uncharacterized protein LOC8276911 [Ricinus communis]|uniref:uncharacterized protein LOC8276911 n=1 Tax=Ricinus communis TaxID=3988 RepID=UPI000772B7E0|nr:uncharacterized protein LOC8276911 [Ricinus communis]|eukprot:XP_015578889.1 uncharacterized protein LOC8276911 [Ricinus communis]